MTSKLSASDGVIHWTDGVESVEIRAWGRAALRVQVTTDAAATAEGPHALTEPVDHEARTVLDVDTASISVGDRIRADLNAAGVISFSDPRTGSAILAEQPFHVDTPHARRIWIRPTGAEIAASFQAHPGERFFGFGQHQHGLIDHAGSVIEFRHHNGDVAIPFTISSRGYGFLWNTPAQGRVELGATATRWFAEGGDRIDYWVAAGDSPHEIIEQYHQATGFPPPMPDWALGLWQSKLRYTSQEELLEVAREYARRDLPLSVIVADYFHWHTHGDWSFDPVEWPNPEAATRELDELGVRLVVSVWPIMSPESANYPQQGSEDLLAKTLDGRPAANIFQNKSTPEPEPVHILDPTTSSGRDFLWQHLRENYLPLGVKQFWLDACEPEFLGEGGRPADPQSIHYAAGPARSVGNMYPLLVAKAVYEGMRESGIDEIVSLSRSAWCGSQKYGCLLWSGDIESTFEALAAQIPAGLSAGLSGIPWWNSDIGGFKNGDPDHPEFRELLVRWFQFGAFSPIFRLHGIRGQSPPSAVAQSGAPNEIWSFGPEVESICTTYVRIRAAMKSYLRTVMAECNRSGAPVMRPLFYEFPDDAASYDCVDQFLLGPDVLVAPVISYGARERHVYLPSGETWTDAWTRASAAGGQTVLVRAPLDQIPLFLRGNTTCLDSVIPQ